MSYGTALRVWGDYACFTRPEMKVERVSYDVMTPSAARGVLSSIYWKPEIRWVVDRIHVMQPIRFTSVRRNEVKPVTSASAITKAIGSGHDVHIDVDESDVRVQRASLVLRDVEYVIEAHFEVVSGDSSNTGKHAEMFKRRARKGQCFSQPYLGTREFACRFALLEAEVPTSELRGRLDLGWMLFDIDYENDQTPRFFRAQLEDGILNVPQAAAGVVR